MLDLYFFPSPNGMKPVILLEELGTPYRIRDVNILRGEQFSADFLAISPNNKVPALVDRDAQGSAPGGGLAIFESGAILYHLADKIGRFLAQDTLTRSATMQWLFWQVGGLGPMAGQAHHFRAFAPQQVPYAIQRYTDECNRLYGVLDRALAGREFVAGEYSIADMAIWPWITPHERQGQDLDRFPNIKRWYRAIEARPAVQRAVAIGAEKPADRDAYRYLYGQTAATAGLVQQEQQS
jgi:GST-like protein